MLIHKLDLEERVKQSSLDSIKRTFDRIYDDFKENKEQFDVELNQIVRAFQITKPCDALSTSFQLASGQLIKDLEELSLNKIRELEESINALEKEKPVFFNDMDFLVESLLAETYSLR